MYRLIVRTIVRRVWARMAAGEIEAPVALASESIRFTFVGDTPMSAEFTGRDRFAQWLRDAVSWFPDLTFEVRDAAVAGWPWRTRVAVRLAIRATLADGSPYANEGVQWLTLRWGKAVDDWVVEDTAALERACAVQSAAAS
jgi:ketosteroid isomerase-like protein